MRTLARRHFRLILADRAYALFLIALPIALAVLALAVPGHAGLRNATAVESIEASQILVLVFVGAAFMGGAASAREVVGERDILLRERASGVQPVAYSLAKTIMFSMVCALQAIMLVAVLGAVKPGPSGGVVLVSATVELGVAVWTTAAASCLLGLLGSAIVRSSEQAMPVLVVTVMAQLVLCGGMIPVTGRDVLSQLSWLVPARWGYSAGAATVDLTGTGADLPLDRLWTHSTYWWSLSLTVLTTGTVILTALLAMRIYRLRRH